MIDTVKSRPTVHELAAWAISGAALLLVFKLHLLPALMAGLLVYELVHISAPKLRISRINDSRARLLVVALMAAFIVTALALTVWAAIFFFRNEATSASALLHKMAEIIEGARDKLPPSLAEHLPDDAEGVRSNIAHWLRGHASALQAAGKEAGLVAAHILVGMVIGAMVSLGDATPVQEYRPLAAALAVRAGKLSEAFRAVVFAQVRISALNTFFAWLYLGIALPLFGVHLPLVKTMLAITFLAGLLPVIGNLVSNAIIIVVSLSHSLAVSASSMAFLVVIHKLEYFLNARIVGSRIKAHAWELLLAILVMEAAFGMAGVIAAPVYYAYVKSELTDRELV